MKSKSITKKIPLLILTFVLLLCLAGCSNGTTAPGSTDNNAVSEPAATPGTDDSDNAQLDTGTTLRDDKDDGENAVDQESLQALVNIMTETAANYRIGVAGSSLVAAEYAGKILDWEANASNTVTTAAAAAQEFSSTLNTDQTAKFSKQMQKIHEAAQQLCGDNGADLLQSCGYEAQSYPWNQDDMEDLFTAILDALN